MTNWSEDLTRFDLSVDISLQQADPDDWGVYYSIYYNMAYNGFFKDQGLTMNHWRRKFWIYKGVDRIGGVVIAPNVIFGLFFIPPFTDETSVMKLLRQALLHWSDRTKDINAYEILPDQIELFARAGFWPGEFRCRWMQRPTETFAIDWEEKLRISSPEFCSTADQVTLTQQAEIIELSYTSYAGTIDGVRRKTATRDDYTAWTNQFPQETNEKLLLASSLVYDLTTSQLIGCCLVSLQDATPAVFNITVAPSHRGQGIATQMLRRALSVLREQGQPILRLYVMQGNVAESVYHNLGFISGPLEVQRCYIPACNADESGLVKRILNLHADGKRLIVGIDGLSRSGKTTLADELKESLQHSQKEVFLFHMDDHIVERERRYNTGREEWAEYYSLQWDIEYLRENLFAKLRNHSQINLPFYNTELDEQVTRAVLLPNNCIIIIEGVFLQREEWREFFDYMAYLNCARAIRFLREGENARSNIKKFQNRYWKAEDHYLDSVCPLVHADMIISSN